MWDVRLPVHCWTGPLHVEHTYIFLYVHPSSLLMYMHREAPNRYDVVDVDPYGSPTDFLDSALQAVDDGGT